MSLDIRAPFSVDHMMNLVLVLTIAFCASATASEQATSSERSFTNSVEVTVVNLAVSVLDPQGLPVTGLGRQAFTVFEDGKQMQLTHFREVNQQGKPVEPELSEDPAKLPGGWVAVAVDLSALHMTNAKRVFRGAEGFLRAAAARGDRIMVATVYPEESIVLPFSSDIDAVLAALSSVQKSNRSGTVTSKSNRMLRLDIKNARARDIDRERIRNQLTLLRVQESARVRTILGNAGDLFVDLAGLPGRTDVLWIGENLSLFPAHDEYRMWWERFCQVIDSLPGCDPPELWSFDADLRRPFQQLAATAHAAGTVIHVIDGGDPDRGLFGADGGGPVGLSSQGGSELLTDGIQGGMYLASATGGSFHGNSRNVTPWFEKLESVTGHWYSVGYTLDSPPDGKMHSVQVRVAADNVIVRHPEKVWYGPAQDQLLASVRTRLAVNGGSNELGITASPEQGGSTLRVRVTIPLKALFTIDGKAQVTCVVAVDVGNEGLPTIISRRLELTAPAADAPPNTLATAVMETGLPPTLNAVVGILDEFSGAMSTVDMVPIPR